MRFKLSFLLLLLTLQHPLIYAQLAGNKVEVLQMPENTDLQSQLIPLTEILEIAVKNSPSVKFQQDLIDAAKSQLNFSKMVWTNNIMGFVNYTTGNQSIVTADNQSAGNLASSNVTSGFRMGVQINLPLYELVGRKSRVNLYKHQLSSTIDKKDESIEALKKDVILAYYNLLYASNMLNIRSEAKESTINQYQIAQKQFKDGSVDISELSRIKSIEVNARADYEEAKRQFSTLSAQFEPLVGVPLIQLMRSK